MAQFARISRNSLSATLAIGIEHRTSAHGGDNRSYSYPLAFTPADALAVAKASEPAITVPHDAHDPSGMKPGEAAIVMADDYGREPLAGKLVAANAERVIIARTDPALGRMHLHVPRAGFILIRG